MKSYRLRTLAVLLFLAMLFMIPALACGGSDEAELVATAEPAQEEAAAEEEVSDVPQEDVAEQPETAEVEEPAAEEETEAEESTSSGPQTFAIGDVVSIGDSVLVVLGWEQLEPTEFFEPDPGNRFVAVEMMIVNQSDEAISLSTLLQMTLKDETAQSYDVDLLAATTIDGGSLDGELAPGEMIRGKVGFQVPEDSGALQFVFDESFWGTGKVFVDLGDMPQSVEPPEEVAGATEQQLYQVGEVISIGDSVLSVLGWEEVAGDDFTQPEVGNRFVAVELVLVNQSDTDANISTVLQMSVKDAASQVYDVDFEASTATSGGSIDGKLVPGERVRGQVGFQVPADSGPLQFVFDAEVFGTGKVNVDLGETPGITEPPAEILGESPLETHAVGEPVQIGDLVVTVHEVTSPPGGGFTAPEEGNVYKVVDVSIENQASEAEAISSLLQMALKDSTGQVYDVDIFAPVESAPDGEIAAGETVRGQVGFQVPAEVEGLVFVFDAEIFGQGKLFVALP